MALQPNVDRISAAASGDRAAFGELVALHRGMVCAITLAVTREPEASEDLAQDVFAAAWRGIRGLRDPRRFAPWLRQLTRNQAHQFLRVRRRQKTRVTADEAAVAAAPDPSGSALEALTDAERDRALAAALAELPDDAREVVILFHREGRSVAEVAERLGLPEPTVRKRLSRARARLQKDVEARLSLWLLATAPGTAFVDRVRARIATIAPSPIGRRPPALRRLAAVVLLGAAGVGGALAVPSRPDPVPRIAAASAVPIARGLEAARRVGVGPAPTADVRSAEEEDGASPPVLRWADLDAHTRLLVAHAAGTLGGAVDAVCLQPLAWERGEMLSLSVDLVLGPDGLRSVSTRSDATRLPEAVEACIEATAWAHPWFGLPFEGELHHFEPVVTVVSEQRPDPEVAEQTARELRQAAREGIALLLEEKADIVDALDVGLALRLTDGHTLEALSDEEAAALEE